MTAILTCKLRIWSWFWKLISFALRNRGFLPSIHPPSFVWPLLVGADGAAQGLTRLGQPDSRQLVVVLPCDPVPGSAVTGRLVAEILSCVEATRRR